MRNIISKRMSREEARRGVVKRSVKELVKNRIDAYGINILVNNNMSNGVLKMMRILKDNYEEVEETKYEIKKDSLHKVNWSNLVSDSDVSYILINAYEEEEEMDMDTNEIVDILNNNIVKVLVERYGNNLKLYFYERSIRLAFASDFETLDKFEGYNWNHGLLAFNNGDPVKNLASLLNHSEWEICCSFDGQYIGPVGISVIGETKIASNMDLFSEIEDEGRCFDTTSYRANYLINSPEEIDRSVCHHGEGIVTNIEVTKVWVKEYWYKENAHIVEELCEMTECSLMIM